MQRFRRMSTEAKKLIDLIEKDKAFTQGATFRVWVSISPTPAPEFVQEVLAHYKDKGSVGWYSPRNSFWYDPK